ASWRGRRPTSPLRTRRTSPAPRSSWTARTGNDGTCSSPRSSRSGNNWGRVPSIDSESRSTMRRATTAIIAVCLVSFGAIVAGAAVPPPPPTYPVKEATMWTQNTQRSLTDQNVGRYNFEAGFYGAVRRAAQRYPSHYLTTGVDPRREAQVAIDSLLHMRPDLPYDHATDAGNPYLMPDWDHDGVFGDSGGFSPSGTGDFDADTDGVQDTAYFMIPCYTAADQWQIHYRYATGACDVRNAGAQPY